MDGTPEQPRASRARPEGRFPRVPALAVAAVLLAAVAFVLLPTGHVTNRVSAEVNGLLLSVPEDTRMADVVGDTADLARPGSKLDLTGDVIGIAEGSPSQVTVDGRPIDAARAIADGTVVVVRHGGHVLEGISKKRQEIPFQTILEGKGVIVSLVQTGKTGLREIYRGDASGKQAGVFTVTPAQNAVVRKSNTTPGGQKLVALTFDDGPDKYTQGVIDALASRNVPATFFVLGGNAAGHKDVIDRLRAAGHEVENHSWSHPVLTELSPEAIQQEITRTSSVIGGSKLLRPPYGSYDAKVAAAAAAVGHRLVLWTVDTLDWKTRDADAILANVKSQTKPGGIILMHDGGLDRSQTVAAIPRVVDWLFANGYSLTTVSRLLKG